MFTLLLDNDLEILPVINKIDLPAADPERVHRNSSGWMLVKLSLASAKAGIRIERDFGADPLRKFQHRRVMLKRRSLDL